MLLKSQGPKAGIWNKTTTKKKARKRPLSQGIKGYFSKNRGFKYQHKTVVKPVEERFYTEQENKDDKGRHPALDVARSDLC